MTYGRQFQRSFDKKGSKSVLLCTTLAFIKFIVHSLAPNDNYKKQGQDCQAIGLARQTYQ